MLPFPISECTARSACSISARTFVSIGAEGVAVVDAGSESENDVAAVAVAVAVAVTVAVAVAASALN